jgi:hypothetical protein
MLLAGKSHWPSWLVTAVSSNGKPLAIAASGLRCPVAPGSGTVIEARLLRHYLLSPRT